MKTRTFFWGWKAYEPTHDPLMDCARALRLFRAWRRSATQGRKNFSIRKVGRHHYEVTCLYANDVATIRWESKA